LKEENILVTDKIKLFNELQIGDMVWAKMPLSDEKLQHIEESHRVRLYLVVGKDKNAIYGFQSSSKRFGEMNNYQTYGINLSKFGYEKNSWIQLVNIEKVPIDNLINYMVDLSIRDLSMIEKRLQIQSNRGKRTRPTFNVPIQICQGDVVQYLAADKMLYYVHFADNCKVIAYPISFQFRKHWIKIKINKKNFYIDLSEQVVITDIKQLKIIDIANNGEIGAIERKIKERPQKSKKRRVKYEIGTVFKTGEGKMMYLYEMAGTYYGVNLEAYRIIPNIKEIRDISECQKVEVYDSEKIKDVVRFLYNNINQPNKRLNCLYSNLI